MQDEKPKTTPNKFLKVLGIILAWLTLPILGVVMLMITGFSSTVPHSFLLQSENTSSTIETLNGLLGIILILLLILFTHSVRKKSYFFHLRIGLYIGLGIYTLILVFGLVMGISAEDRKNNTAQVCSTTHQQYRNHADAVVPIATDLGTGSGFAVGNGSTILTAYHVIEGAGTMYANYSSGQVSLEIIDTAPQYDLALLRLAEPTSTYFTLSESYETADEVYAYGYPGNSLTAGPPSVSTGIISRVIDLASLRMTSQDAADGLEIVQTDAAINPGNSGGPLIGKCGVVGVVSFISDRNELHEYIGSVSEQNIGFAISSKTAKQAFSQYLP